MVFFKEVWSWNKFGVFGVFRIIRLKVEVNLFIWEFFEDFYFPSTFIVVIESS